MAHSLLKNYGLIAALLAWALTAAGQEKATTEGGRPVLLHPDGRWEYAPAAEASEEEVMAAGEAKAEEMERQAWAYADSVTAAEAKTASPTSTVFMGGRRLTAGVSTLIHEERFGFRTSVSVARDGDRTLIIFWQDSDDHQINFFDWHWEGSVYLYLANGQSITLTDRGMHGQNKLTGAKAGEYGMNSDVYQRYSAHYLTAAECQLLKRSTLAQVAYRTNSSHENGTVYMPVTENQTTLREQLRAIGR